MVELTISEWAFKEMLKQMQTLDPKRYNAGNCITLYMNEEAFIHFNLIETPKHLKVTYVGEKER